MNALMIALVAMAFPFISAGQTKNLLSTHRVFPKVDKIMEFEKALAAHAQKYHKGDQAWHVFKIQSGPDAGGYQITEGPTSWTAEDTRGDLGPEHMMDWHKNIAIHLTERRSIGYSVYQDSLSTIALNDWTDKVSITHVYPKPGHVIDVENLIKKLQKTWKAEGIFVAVYMASASGRPQYTMVTRYKQGLKEREKGFRRPMKEAFEAANGPGSFEQYLKDYEVAVEERWEELLFMSKELGSK